MEIVNDLLTALAALGGLGFFWCCCGPQTCDAVIHCTGCSPTTGNNAPGSWKLVVAGIANDDCDECTSLNGTYYFDDASVTGAGGDCEWLKLFHNEDPDGVDFDEETGDPYVCNKIWAYGLSAICNERGGNDFSDFSVVIFKYPLIGAAYRILWQNSTDNCRTQTCTQMKMRAISLETDSLGSLCDGSSATAHVSCRNNPGL